MANKGRYLAPKEPTHLQAAVEDWQMGLITCNRLGEIMGLPVFELTPQLLALEKVAGSRMGVSQRDIWKTIKSTPARVLALIEEEIR